LLSTNFPLKLYLHEDKLKNVNSGKVKIKIQTIYNWNQTRELLLQRAFLAIEPEKLDETLKVLEPFIVDRKSADAVPFLICNKPTDDKVSARLQLVEQRLRAARNQALSLVNTPNFKELEQMWWTNRKAMYNKYYDMFKSYSPNKAFYGINGVSRVL
jgi:hypothetical protein